MRNTEETIAAIASAAGEGAIAMVRLSGEKSIEIANKIFFSRSLPMLSKAKSNHQYFGEIKDREKLIDEVLLSVFRSPHSYTGEDSVEISCHGSVFIQEKILQLLIEHGARAAEGGEFTMRAFMNNKMDLSQAEAVADLIASQSAASHKIALDQMRGGFSHKIKDLREKMLNFISLMELELDFSEEEVEFADRQKFFALIKELKIEIQQLINSFQVGNVIKNGIPVAIVGEPNVGKSTLLNALLEEERAIVSDIPGTTRDTIEELINIDGFLFRFMDTAGLRESEDKIEKMGVVRAFAKLHQAMIVLAIFDSSTQGIVPFQQKINKVFKENSFDFQGKLVLYIGNKSDLSALPKKAIRDENVLYISAKKHFQIDDIKTLLVKYIKVQQNQNQLLVNNIRHYEALQKTHESLLHAEEGFEIGMPTDLISVDIRAAIYNLGAIVGEISTPEILQTIFGRFCIGK